jgi:hypothetical protein
MLQNLQQFQVNVKKTAAQQQSAFIADTIKHHPLSLPNQTAKC